MAQYLTGLDDVFIALADPTRRGIIARLGGGAASVGELAADTAMTLPSFLKHIRILERGGLVRTAKSGRVRMCTLDRERFAVASDWLAEQRAAWERHTDRLADFVEREPFRSDTRRSDTPRGA